MVRRKGSWCIGVILRSKRHTTLTGLILRMFELRPRRSQTECNDARTNLDIVYGW